MAKVSLIQIFNLYTNCVDAPGNDGAWGLVLNIYIFGVVSLSGFENRVSDAVGHVTVRDRHRGGDISQGVS